MMARLVSKVGHWFWLASYSLEELREAHADARRYWRSGWCCFGLALLRLGRFTQ